MRELLATRPLAKPCGKEADITIFTWAANCTLTTGCPYALGMSKNDCSKPAGRRHAHAIGYVTLEIIADCTDLHNPGAFESLGAGNLTGSYEQIVQGRVFASGPLIDRAATNWRFRRQRLPFDPLAKQPPKECQPILCILPPPVP